jgi:hypothetical protein
MRFCTSLAGPKKINNLQSQAVVRAEQATLNFES